MLITPVDRPFNWKQPPRLSLGLSLVLLLIFAPWHLADLRLERGLVQQYTQTLLATEWPLYETHALKTGQGRELAALKQDYAAGKMDRIALYIGMDDGFVAAMQQSGQDYLTAERFSAWKRARADFDPQRGRLGGRALGIDPQQFRPITFLTFGLVQPGMVEMAVALLLLLTFGRRGPAGAFLAEHFGIVFSFRWTGAALACAVMGFPLMVRAIRLSIESVDRRLEAAAGTLGANVGWVFATVTLPLILPGIIAGMILSFAKAMGEFGATITFVSNIPNETQTLPSAIYTFTQIPGGDEGALRLTLISIIISMAALVVSEVLARRVGRRLNLE